LASGSRLGGFGRGVRRAIRGAIRLGSVRGMRQTKDPVSSRRAAGRNGHGVVAKRILVVAQLDGYANSVRAAALERVLRDCGHEVHLVDTFHLSRGSGVPGSSWNRLPGPSIRQCLLYAVEAASVPNRRWAWGRRHLSYFALVADRGLRRSILKSSLALNDFDLIICETPHDAGVLAVDSSAETLYDCPTPWVDELYFERRLTERQHRLLGRRESAIYEGVDHLAFHWETYAKYAIEHCGISGRNLLTLNFGCTPSGRRAAFANPPSVVYMGSLSSGFIDLPLLSRLSRLYPHIDVYGGPPPDPSLGLNYRGHAPPAVLEQYQLGLVTCTKDELRREGFSAKHVEYLAHGLPVLVPAWRRHLGLLEGSVAYDEQTFLAAIDALRAEPEWRRMSDLAYVQAQRLAWEETLRPLSSLLAEPRIEAGDPK